jgi:hypothetical protein
VRVAINFTCACCAPTFSFLLAFRLLAIELQCSPACGRTDLQVKTFATHFFFFLIKSAP